jgi:hypothetical protein
MSKINQGEELQIRVNTRDLQGVERLRDGWKSYQFSRSQLLDLAFICLAALTGGYAGSLVLLNFGLTGGWWATLALPPILMGVFAVITKNPLSPALSAIATLIGIFVGMTL